MVGSKNVFISLWWAAMFPTLRTTDEKDRPELQIRTGPNLIKLLGAYLGT